MTQWLYLRNPVSGETKALQTQDAKRLKAYGWETISKAEWDEIQQAYATLMMKRSLGPGKFREH